jgi:hypothetical protein
MTALRARRRSPATSRTCRRFVRWEPLAATLDTLFLHRVRRLVRKDGTVSYQGGRFEVPFELTGKTVCLRVDPHTETVVGVENDAGELIGRATPLDALANRDRRRRQAGPGGGRTGQAPRWAESGRAGV